MIDFWKKEMEKCIESPYYFATNYMTILTERGTEKLKTPLSEDEFNGKFKSLHNTRSYSDNNKQ